MLKITLQIWDYIIPKLNHRGANSEWGQRSQKQPFG